MRKIIFITIVISVIFSSVVAAQTALPDAGLLPDSPFYFLKQWKEQIQLFFIFNAENKAKQYLYLAEVRLAEYERMLEKGKNDIAEKTLTKYQNQLNRALQKTEEIKQKGKDIRDLSQQIETTTSKHLEVLQQNLAKVPETAKKGLETAIENSQKGIERVLEVKIEKEKKQEELGNETSDWKTYRNEEYGFQFQYPEDKTLEFEVESYKFSDYESLRNNSGLILEDIAEHYVLLSSGVFVNSSKLTQVALIHAVDGVVGAVFREDFGGWRGLEEGQYFEGSRYFAVFKNSVIGVIIECNYSVYPEIYNQVFSTFKFTK